VDTRGLPHEAVTSGGGVQRHADPENNPVKVTDPSGMAGRSSSRDCSPRSPARAKHVVTGAYGYSGRYIAKRLLDNGKHVRTLTNSIHRANPFGDRVEAVPFHFDDPPALRQALENASVLYNTYWIRFDHKDFRQSSAVQNTLRLFEAAKVAGVRRVVHVSITNPSEESPLPYFRGKAMLERALIDSGLSYAILRPTVLFGEEDILVNNIAWSLRRFPLFAVFGDGAYRLQPIHVDDLAALAVDQGEAKEDVIIDAVGPESFSYRELVRDIGAAIGKERPVLSAPPALAYAAGWVIGKLVGDVTITWDEVKGLMADLLWTPSPPAGTTKLSEWARAHADTLGRRYKSELARRRDRKTAYDDL
jgi:NADH dehydrogenase